MKDRKVAPLRIFIFAKNEDSGSGTCRKIAMHIQYIPPKKTYKKSQCNLCPQILKPAFLLD